MNLEEIFPDDNALNKPTATKVTAADGHVYHKSSSANATEAPTNTGTIEKAANRALDMIGGGSLTYPQTEFVLMCQMHYEVYGTLIPVEVAVKRYGITEDIYRNMLDNDAVREALTKNGVLKPAAASEPILRKDSILTPKQIIVANVMMDLLDTRSDKKKLQDNNTSTLEWQRWLRQPAFQEYLREKGESVLTTGQHEAALALMDRVRAGDSKAIALYWEYIGKFTAKPSGGTTVNVNGPNGNADLQFIVTRLIEIIIDEVDDGPTAARIGDRIKALIGANRVAQQLTEREEVIETPHVAPMRDQTDVIKAIEMRAGVNKDG